MVWRLSWSEVSAHPTGWTISLVVIWGESSKWVEENNCCMSNRTQASHYFGFQVQHSPFLASEAFATEEIFKLLFIYYLILDDFGWLTRIYWA